MGNCCLESKDKQKLEDEVSKLLSANKNLEAKLKTDTSVIKDALLEVLNDCERNIEKEQYITSKVFDFFQAFLETNTESSKKVSGWLTELPLVPRNKRIQRYTEIRYGETEETKSTCNRIYDSNKKLIDIVNQKYQEIDERIETIQRLLKGGTLYNEQMQSIRKSFEEIPKEVKQNFEFSIEKLSRLITVEKEIVKIEKALPDLSEDNLLILSLKEIEKGFLELTKHSTLLVKHLELKLGESKSEKSFDLSLLDQYADAITYTLVAESIVKSIKNLQNLENLKEEILRHNEITIELQELDKMLANHFSKSVDSKEAACFKLNRLSQGKNESSLLFTQMLKYIEINNNSIPKAVRALKENTLKFLKASEEQDKVILEMTQKFEIFQLKFDDFELKVDEMLSSQLKDLSKSILHWDSNLKTSVDELKDELANNLKGPAKNLSEHISFLLTKIELTPRIGALRTQIRESWIKDIARIKAEHQDKVNDLVNSISLLESEKSALENSINTLQSNHEKATELVDKMIKTVREKETEIVYLKNSLASLQEQYDQMNEELRRSQDDIDRLTKENRDIKKNLRARENELAELKEI